MPKSRISEPLPSPELAVLFRDAEPLWREIEGERDVRKRAENERRRDLATAELFRMYRDAKAHKRMESLPYRVRRFCDGLMARLPTRAAKAMRARTGAPPKEEHQFKIAVAVAEAAEALGGKRGSIDKAIMQIGSRLRNRRSAGAGRYESVKEIYYSIDKREIEVELSRRKLEQLQENPIEADRQRSRFARRMKISKPR